MAWCGYSRKGRPCLASSGGGAAGWSVFTSIPYIPWRRRSSKALRPFSRGVYGWVFCAKNWQLCLPPPPAAPPAAVAEQGLDVPLIPAAQPPPGLPDEAAQIRHALAQTRGNVV